ncbi:MAG: heme NO-binding domain-containing protein [Pseudomonadota bacterium]
MHGLINRAVERFARDTYGDAFWTSVAQSAGLEFSTFEAMLPYAYETTERVVEALAEALDKRQDEVLEDLGTYLVASPNTDGLRRLLRFGGTGFVEFLNSLDELPARAQLAVPDLPMPQLELREVDPTTFTLAVTATPETGDLFGHVMVGLLRAMADDYGALVFLNHMQDAPGQEIIEIILLEVAFAEAREFELGARAG